MQKAPTATISAGPVAPAIVGPDRDMKDVYILSGLIGFLAIVVAAFWYYSQADEAAHSNRSSEALDNSQISQVLKDSTDKATVSAAIPITHVETAPLASRSIDILHDDILFEIGRKGLSDDGKAALQRHAEFLKNEPDWGVLLQGYTDQQGSMSFNKILGMKRAETVKQQLISLGVPESAIRTVSLGEEGALCIDKSDVCRQMNRRVHVEMRKVGHEHMLIPVILTEPVTDSFSSTSDLAVELAPVDSSIETPSPSDASSDKAETPAELATGN
ncbi:MAG: OmpA family protein [Nitrospira sp.]|nr:OmpA family protein [Nitrospira sp.]